MKLTSFILYRSQAPEKCDKKELPKPGSNLLRTARHAEQQLDDDGDDDKFRMEWSDIEVEAVKEDVLEYSYKMDWSDIVNELGEAEQTDEDSGVLCEMDWSDIE
jgi:hypothetical protein